MVPCDVITKRGAVIQSLSARKVVECDGFYQSGGVRGNKARLKQDKSKARCLVMRTPPSRKGGGVML